MFNYTGQKKDKKGEINFAAHGLRQTNITISNKNESLHPNNGERRELNEGNVNCVEAFKNTCIN